METKDKKYNDNILINSKQGSNNGDITIEKILKVKKENDNNNKKNK